MSLTKAFTGGSSSSSYTAPDTVWGVQSPFLESLYQGGQDLQQWQQQFIGPAAREFSGQLYGQGQQFLQGMGAGAGQQLNPFIQDNGIAQGQIASLQGLLQRNLDQNLAGINQGAIAAGGLGGARQGLAQGTAIGDNQLALGAGAADIMSQDWMRRQQAAQAQAGLQAQSALGGLSQLGNMFNLGMSPFGAEFAPLQNLAGLIGAPAILGGASRSTTSSSTGYLPASGQFLQGAGSVVPRPTG